jgi:hypothetical protein
MPQHKPGGTTFFTPSQPSRTNLVQNPWDYHGTKIDVFLKRQHRYSPRKSGTLENETPLRVVSNLSFTATLSKHKPLIFLEKVGGLWFLAFKKSPVSGFATGSSRMGAHEGPTYGSHRPKETHPIDSLL